MVVEHRNGVRIYRKIGRPPGKKDSYKRTRRKKVPQPTKESFESALLALGQNYNRESDESFDSAMVLLTRASCYNGPKAPMWLEAENKEQLTLEVAKCWRPITDEDLKDIQEIVPSCVLYTQKRDGTYKARLVALGNIQKAEMAGEIYSPTISHIANRALLIHAAAEGNHISGFDLTAAFINATVASDEHIFIR